ncbi:MULTISPECIES: LysR family transcriptional regulator [unclassified Bradyrhizobium]|uniref:LysR family transcriptional regulator n=1 Tax=unclassified Bradyrhizobium TaxID=2631580 RepID=UPI001BA9E719|nr:MULTISPECIES: LysR family transcriptional regulator [unclassified Bradyrhizobium]MBR1207166.1 LysR family transcriptional regulator [Bradyrhizobium sp. AUGA SZCCT0124]MBR1313705.1 LysR family transcriptional regulator [Bradyrhizobium sp. AUGA SZCCT0051]MBR1343198.1 LysR family transcriptional regulator [Bradyrhizobium sp. AUGA SZCCT0105]MBR1357382.1 LysR family transcriptional regulator [Bradyrhizobium sp. AUGA SZCCT0045]
MQHPGLFELNAVVAISTHRSFRAAATELGISPSALSHSIAALEKRLGVRLINRTTRSVALSEAGERFLARVSPALREIAGAMEDVNEFRDTPAGTLRINLKERAAHQILRPVVAKFLRRYPDMNVELTLEGRPIDIVAEGFDAGIRLAEAVPQDMVAIPCGPDTRFIVVGAPDYFARCSVPRSPLDLLAHECIRRRMPSGKLYHWEFEKRGGEQMVVDVRGRLTLDNDTLMVEAALDGLGLAFVSDFWVTGHLAAGTLRAVLDDWTPPFPGLRLYYPRHRHMTAGLRAFVDMVREETKLAARGGEVRSPPAKRSGDRRKRA